MTRSKEEALAYQRGYATGRKRKEIEQRHELERAERSLFKRQVFLAILPELVRRPWQDTIDGQRVTWSTRDCFIRGAWDFADAAAERASFNGLTLASAIEARSDATGTGAAEGESATRQGDAQEGVSGND